MNRCGYEAKSCTGGGCCEGRRMKMMMMRDSLVCPKPRRLRLLNPSYQDPISIRPLPLNLHHQSEMAESEAAAELLDIFLTKGGYVGEKPSYSVASSPPFYCGSPPSRASNPVIQDAQFCNEENMIPLSLAPPSPSSFSSAHRGAEAGGCVRMKHGHKPAAVRIEGFDCLSRDHRNCSISAVA